MFVILKGGALTDRPAGSQDQLRAIRQKCWEGKWGLWLFVRR